MRAREILVDVVMTTYNASRYLTEALESIQRQSLGAIRIIIVDDGSSDDTTIILRRMAASDVRILLMEQPHCGIVEAANAGLAVATAPFVARADADDLSDVDRLDKQLSYLLQNQDCVAVASAARHIDREGHQVGTISRLASSPASDPTWIAAREPYLLHPFLMIRTSALRKIGFYRKLLASEDSDLFWRLQDEGRMHNMEDILGSYRLHPDSISSKSIVHGRQMAFCSQIAALSEQRRSGNRSDLHFDEEMLRQVRLAQEIPQLIDTVRFQIDPVETEWLSIATAVKLLKLCLYRPYKVSGSDCLFIQDTLKTYQGPVSVENRREIDEFLIATAVHLLLQRRLRDALVLCPSRLVPLVLLRTFFRITVPEPLKRRLKTFVGR